MRLTKRVRSISYLKSNAAELVKELAAGAEPLVITQNGEATAVLQDVASWEAREETLAMLKLLALGQRQVETGRTVTATTALRKLRARLRSAR